MTLAQGLQGEEKNHKVELETKTEKRGIFVWEVAKGEKQQDLSSLYKVFVKRTNQEKICEV